MALTETKIMAMLNSYVGTSAGKKSIKQIKDEIISGKIKKPSGSKIPTFDEMEQAAAKLCHVVGLEAREHERPDGGDVHKGIPHSVVSIIENIDYGKPKKISDTEYSIDLYFTNVLQRPSLMPSKYEGINNIVALFNNGEISPKSKYVYGEWHGEFHRGITSREGTHFIEQAVNDFNGNYGALYNATAEYDTEIYG